MQYDIYRNLKNNLLSIKEVKSNKVVGHCKAIHIADATFKTNIKGIKRIRKNKRKEVVASVRGVIVGVEGFKAKDNRVIFTQIYKRPECETELHEIVFNPYINNNFAYKYEDNFISKAIMVNIDCKGKILALKEKEK